MTRSDFEAYIKRYYQTLPDTVAKSNNDVDKILAKTEEGYEPHYYKLVCAKGREQGLACFNYDNTNMGGHRCVITHLSTVDPENMAQALDLLVNHVWREMNCNDIRVSLFHIRDEQTGTMKADPHMKSVYTTKKFKWKTLSNDPSTGKRAQIMQLNNPDSCERQEPYQIKLALVLNLQPTLGQAKAHVQKELITPITELSLGLGPVQIE